MQRPRLASKLWRTLTLKAPTLPAADIVSPRPPTWLTAGQRAWDIGPKVISSVTSVTRPWTALGLVLALFSGLMSSAAGGDDKARGLEDKPRGGEVESRGSTNKSGDFEEKARASIEVEGNKRVDIATVRSYFHASSDGRFD